MSIDEAERVMAGEPDDDARWTPEYPTEGDVAGARRFLNVCADTGDPQPFGAYELRRRTDGYVIGGLAFHGRPDENGGVTIGYGLVRSAHGQGYASEALRELLLFARAHGVTCVRGDTARDNIASQHVMAAVGMQLAAEDAQLKYYTLTWTDTVATA